MSDRSVRLLLEDIEMAIGKILFYTKGYSFADYESDDRTKDAVVRNFQIIGEASNRLPTAFRNRYSAAPWRLIKDFRNIVIHEYFGIDDLIVWDTIQLKIPELKAFITKVLSFLPPEFDDPTTP